MCINVCVRQIHNPINKMLFNRKYVTIEYCVTFEKTQNKFKQNAN